MKQKITLFLFLFIALGLHSQVLVTTLAGSSAVGSTDGKGTGATFYGPRGLVVDGSGNVYVADNMLNKIRVVDPSGIVTTLIDGSSRGGFVNGKGSVVRFNRPTGLAIDASGNIYVSDQSNHAIRKIAPSGEVSTFAGSGTAGSADGTGTAASFNYPYGIAIDASGNLYVADSDNHLIRKITSAGAVTTLAGSGVRGFADGIGTAASFNYPYGVAVDASGNVYVADTSNSAIRKITPEGVVSIFAGSTSRKTGLVDGIGTAARFDSPRGLTVDASGNLYVADSNYNRVIRKITPEGVVSTFAGAGSGDKDGLGTVAGFSSPNEIAVDASGNLYVTDNNKIRKIIPFTCNLKAIVTSHINVACNGTATGEASVSASGGTGPFTYLWSPSGGTAATASRLSVGTYTCTVTDAYGCQATESFTITQPSALLVTGSQTDLVCHGSGNGSATVNVSGGTGNYTYLWEPSGATEATASGLSAGTYTCTVTDENGCAAVQSFTIAEPSEFSVIASQTNPVCHGGSNGSATVVVSGGSGTYSYEWSPSGGTAPTASGLRAGTYTCKITDDANGCAVVQSFTITQPSALSITPSYNTATCNGSATGSASVTVWGGTAPYSYLWSPSVSTGATASGLIAGYYTCTVTDAKGCQAVQSFTITQPMALSVTSSHTDVVCHGGASGSATVSVSGGTGSYTYLWEPSGATEATVSGLSAGTYTCTITDENGCAAVQSFTIAEPSEFSVIASQTNPACHGGSNGSATVVVSGGKGSYSYKWSPSGGTAPTASGLIAGNYTCLITDNANGCEVVKSFTITEPSALLITPSQTNVVCKGTATGSARVNASGGSGSYTYLWSPSGGTGASASGLIAGKYTCTVTDAKGCEAVQSFTITQPSALLVSGSQTDLVCHGAANGSARVSVSGGSGSYTYLWSPSGGTDSTASGLIAGTYTCTITDENGCQVVETFTIAEPEAMRFTSQTLADYDYNLFYNASIVASGGTGVKNYKVTSGSLPKGFSLSEDGMLTGSSVQIGQSTFTLTVTDQNNCSVSQDFTLKLSQIPIRVSVSASQGKVYGQKDPVLTYSVTPALLPGDIFTGSLARDPGENAGSYPINQGTLSAGNKYLITYIGSNFNITKAEQIIAFDQDSEIGCNGETSISLTASASSGLDVNYNSSNPAIATVSNGELVFKGYGSVRVTALQTGNDNYNSAPLVELVFTRNQPNLIRQQFGNILFFDNSSKEFASYKWYKNGVLVPGQTSQYFKENGTLEGSYYAVAVKKDGTLITGCPLELSAQTVEEYIKIVPNPVKANADYELMTNISALKLQNAFIEVYNTMGVLVDKKNVTAPGVSAQSSTSLKAPSVEGIYIVKMALANGKYYTKNLLIRN